MKNVIFVCGTMGVGKTATCRALQNILDKNVFLDGDWCWDAKPFIVTEYTCRMVERNIAYLLNSFIACPDYENIIFCWVMHRQQIIDDLKARLPGDYSFNCFALTCRADALKQRLDKDVARAIRTPDVLSRSIPRLPLYEALSAQKIDVSDISAEAAALEIARRLDIDSRG